MKRRIQRNALNRGTAVHLGGARVRFVWACGCKQVETVTSPAGPMSESAVARLVRNWRANGVVLAQCKRHPDWYEKRSPLARLNEKNPTTGKATTTKKTNAVTIESVIAKYSNFSVWPTGGGCEAYGHPLENGGHILITAVDDPSLPEPDDKFVHVGAYDSNADPVGKVRRCAVRTLEKTIDRMIRKGGRKLTFKQFQRTGDYVDDLETYFPGEHKRGTPGRIYAGRLVIAHSHAAKAGEWMLTIGNSSRCSNDLEALERELYEYGRGEGHI